MSYPSLVPVLVKAMQEQQEHIEALRAAQDAEVRSLRMEHETKITELRAERDAEMGVLTKRVTRLESILTHEQKDIRP